MSEGIKTWAFPGVGGSVKELQFFFLSGDVTSSTRRLVMNGVKRGSATASYHSITKDTTAFLISRCLLWKTSI